MPQKIVFSNQAAEKLASIFNDVQTRFGKESKERVKKAFQKTIISASLFPELGKQYNERLRFLIVKKKTLLFYRFENGVMYIVAVFTARENWVHKI